MKIKLTHTLTIEINSFAELIAALIKYPLDNNTLVRAVINDQDFLKIFTKMSEIEQFAEKINSADLHDSLFEKIVNDRKVFKQFFKFPPDLVIGLRIFSRPDDLLKMYVNYVCNLLGDGYTEESVRIAGITLLERESFNTFIQVHEEQSDIMSQFVNTPQFINVSMFTNTAIKLCGNEPKQIKLIIFGFWFFMLFFNVYQDDANAFQEVVNRFKKYSFTSAANSESTTNIYSVPSAVMIRYLHDISDWIPRTNEEFCEKFCRFYNDLRQSIPMIDTNDRYKDIRTIPNMILLLQRRGSVKSRMEYLIKIKIRNAANKAIDSDVLYYMMKDELLSKYVVRLKDFAMVLSMFPNKAPDMLKFILCENIREASQVLQTYEFKTQSYNEKELTEFFNSCYSLISLYLSRHRLIDTPSAAYLYQMFFLAKIAIYLFNNQVKQIGEIPDEVAKVLKEKFFFFKLEASIQFKQELADAIKIAISDCVIPDQSCISTIEAIIAALNERKMLSISSIPNRLLGTFVISSIPASFPQIHTIQFNDYQMDVEEISIPGDGFCLAESAEIENPRMILQNILDDLKHKTYNENHPIILKLVDALSNDLQIGQLDQDSKWFASFPDDTGGSILEKVMSLLAACQQQNANALAENSGPELALRNYLKNQKILQYYVQYLIDKNYYNTIIATLLLNYPNFPQPPKIIGIVRPQPNGELKLDLPDNVNLLQGDKINPNIKFVIFRDNPQKYLLSHYNRLKVLEIKPVLRNIPRAINNS